MIQAAKWLLEINIESRQRKTINSNPFDPNRSLFVQVNARSRAKLKKILFYTARSIKNFEITRLGWRWATGHNSVQCFKINPPVTPQISISKSR